MKVWCSFLTWNTENFAQTESAVEHTLFNMPFRLLYLPTILQVLHLCSCSFQHGRAPAVHASLIAIQNSFPYTTLAPLNIINVLIKAYGASRSSELTVGLPTSR